MRHHHSLIISGTLKCCHMIVITNGSNEHARIKNLMLLLIYFICVIKRFHKLSSFIS